MLTICDLWKHARVTKKSGKGNEVAGPSGDGHFAIICLTR
jgi:hypothetical protein